MIACASVMISSGLQLLPNHRRFDMVLSMSMLWQDPKGGELCSAMVNPWETVVEASRNTDVQIVCRSGA